MEMARKPRLEFAGAIYHVLSRGNYRQELFDDDSATLFDKALFQASAKCSWLLHAYVIMSNYCDLAVETSEGNLLEHSRGGQSYKIHIDIGESGKGPDGDGTGNHGWSLRERSTTC